MFKKIILVIIFFLGLSILLYPSISQYFNSLTQSRAITDYEKMNKRLDDDDYNNIFKESDEYNQELFNLKFPLTKYKSIKNYQKLLNINNDGMMGYISIDKLGIKLPIYHGTSASILNVAVGHLEGSSLPVGGPSTHSVLSAHRGHPSAKLFTNLNKLEIGDIFIINVLNRELVYQVNKILIVEPNDVKALEIIEGLDLVTLITCTPYGINTHRLLVQGERIDSISDADVIITSDACKIDNIFVSIAISIIIFIILIIYMLLKSRLKKKEVIYEEFIKNNFTYIN